jgi:hypothetical protein
MSELVKAHRGEIKKDAASRRKGGAKPKKGEKTISAEVRERMIAEAAYYKAEHRGFAGGTPERDWYEAESEIDALLLGNKARG